MPIALVVELLDVDQGRALRPQHRQRRVERRLSADAEAKRITPMRLPRSAPASSAGGIVDPVPVGLAGGRVGRVAAGDRRQHTAASRTLRSSARRCPGYG